MIEIRDMCAGYGDRQVLDHVNITLEPGRITALIGPNGCGKSTLLKTIVRVHEHSGGEIIVNGTSVVDLNSTGLAQQVAYLPQNKKAPDMSVLRMVLHGRFAYLSYPRKYRAKDVEIARRSLRWVGMEEMEDEIVSHLSGGMQQKVYIAMALAQDADTILMDEPTTYLDVAYQLRLMELARRLADEGKAVVMVLHDLSHALRIADQIVVMEEGRIVQTGTAQDVFESGILPAVFGVEIERVCTKSGWHYVCTSDNRSGKEKGERV